MLMFSIVPYDLNVKMCYVHVKMCVFVICDLHVKVSFLNAYLLGGTKYLSSETQS